MILTRGHDNDSSSTIRDSYLISTRDSSNNLISNSSTNLISNSNDNLIGSIDVKRPTMTSLAQTVQTSQTVHFRVYDYDTDIDIEIVAVDLMSETPQIKVHRHLRRTDIAKSANVFDHDDVAARSKVRVAKRADRLLRKTARVMANDVGLCIDTRSFEPIKYTDSCTSASVALIRRYYTLYLTSGSVNSSRPVGLQRPVPGSALRAFIVRLTQDETDYIISTGLSVVEFVRLAIALGVKK